MLNVPKKANDAMHLSMLVGYEVRVEFNKEVHCHLRHFTHALTEYY